MTEVSPGFVDIELPISTSAGCSMAKATARAIASGVTAKAFLWASIAARYGWVADGIVVRPTAQD